MASAIQLLDVYSRLSEPNRFAVLVYARFKFARQMMEECKLYVQERRRACRVKYPSAHWVFNKQ